MPAERDLSYILHQAIDERASPVQLGKAVGNHHLLSHRTELSWEYI